MELLTEPHLSCFVQLHFWEPVRVRHASLIKATIALTLFNSGIFEHRGRTTSNSRPHSISSESRISQKGYQLPRGYINLLFCKFLQQYCMTMKEFRPEVRAPGASLDSPLYMLESIDLDLCKTLNLVSTNL